MSSYNKSSFIIFKPMNSISSSCSFLKFSNKNHRHLKTHDHTLILDCKLSAGSLVYRKVLVYHTSSHGCHIGIVDSRYCEANQRSVDIQWYAVPIDFLEYRLVTPNLNLHRLMDRQTLVALIFLAFVRLGVILCCISTKSGKETVILFQNSFI